jgi:hypothetical protein
MEGGAGRRGDGRNAYKVLAGRPGIEITENVVA